MECNLCVCAVRFLNEKIKHMQWLTVSLYKQNLIASLGVPVASVVCFPAGILWGFFCGMYFFNLLDEVVNVDGFLTAIFPGQNKKVRLDPLDKHHLSLLTAARTQIFRRLLASTASARLCHPARRGLCLAADGSAVLTA